MITKIKNGRIITDRVLEGASLYFEGGTITAVTAEDLPCDRVIDAENNFVSAGFIDIHTHGAGGHDFMDGSVEDVLCAAQEHMKYGATSLVPTVTTGAPEIMAKAIDDIKEAMGVNPGILGVHVEGPYFSQNQRGAQDPRYIKPPDKNEYTALNRRGEGSIKRWSFAPELPGSAEFCGFLLENGIIPSIAHSDAVYEEVLRVYDMGCRLLTHFYSGMSTITRVGGFRRLGVIETGYLLDDMRVEVIADGCHLPPELLRLIYKCKGTDNICAVTDSMRAAGRESGPSIIGDKTDGVPCIIEDGVAKLYDRSSFAGSVATADRLVRTLVKSAGIDIAEAVKMITRNPADVMGLGTKGILEKGCDADIVIFDDDIRIKQVIAGGRTHH